MKVLLKARKVIHNASRKDNPYANALIESFYRTLKRELIQDVHFKTPEQAQKVIFKISYYIIIRNVCISLWDTFRHPNLRNSIHKVHLTLCLKNLTPSVA